MERMQTVVIWIMRIGIFVSFLLVLSGAMVYLWQDGQNSVEYERIYDKSSLKLALSSFPFLLIDLGVLVLVITQILRVALMGWFFMLIRDYKFSLISLFVLVMVLAIFFGFL